MSNGTCASNGQAWPDATPGDVSHSEVTFPHFTLSRLVQHLPYHSTSHGLFCSLVGLRGSEEGTKMRSKWVFAFQELTLY